MPFIPCGFGGNWLLWRHSPAAFLPSKSPSSSGTYETSTRQTDRMLHGDLRVKYFFFFLQPMITVLQAPAHHTAWANDDAAMHVDGGWDISILCFWLPNIAFISVFLLYRILMYHDIILSWKCRAFHSVKRQHSGRKTWEIDHLAQRFCRIGISSHIITSSKPSLMKVITSPPELLKRR